MYTLDDLPLEPEPITRRRFLGVAASVAGAPLVRPGGPDEPPSKLLMPPGALPSRVILVQSSKVVDDATVHRILLAEMLQRALTDLAGVATVAEAWRSFLKPGDVIGIKFNRSGRQMIGTTDAMVEALVASLIDAGWPPTQIVCIEAPDGTERRLGTTSPVHGYDSSPTDFGSGSDHLAAALSQITALINVPFLKTHNIAGITGALKNLSHGLIKHPARYHDNACSPYIADIVAIPQIRNRLRLCVMDALRTVYEGGPEPTTDTLSNEGIILLSKDPVAVDSVGLTLLNETRRHHQLPRLADSAEEVPHLAAAHRRGVGIAIPHGISVVRVQPH